MKAHESGEALETFRRYADAFQALDAKAVSRYFHEPSILITPQGVASLRTIADVEHAYAGLMAGLPARGYAGTEFTSLVERQLSDDLATVDGTGVWKKATGETFAPFGVLYTLRRVEMTWRIIVASIYQSSAVG